MTRRSHLVTALCVLLPALGAAAQAAPANQPAVAPAPSPAKTPNPAKPAAKSPPTAAAPAAAPAAAAPAAASPSVAPPAAGPSPSVAPNSAPINPPPTSAAEPAPAPAAPQPDEPLGLGEQPGGVVYGADAAPGQTYPYQPSVPEWAQAQCPHDRCGQDCRLHCGRNEFCSEYNACEAIPELIGQQHKGLMLRATSGYGFGSLSASDAGVREGSLVVGLGVDVGGAVIEDLIVRGRVRGAVSYYRENAFGTNTLFSFGTAGVGIDYYFMPINIYLGGTLSVAGISRADEDNVTRSKAGIGLDLDAGKEWWVSRRWGIGIALRATYIDVAPANVLKAAGIRITDARMRSLHVGLQFSATFN